MARLKVSRGVIPKSPRFHQRGEGSRAGSRRALYHFPVPPITAFILAGGKSSRMGSDKAFLDFGGQSLLHRALGLARSVVPDVRIVGDPQKFTAFAPTIADIYPACGPLGGIHAALTATTTDLNLILAVDLPFLDTRFLQYLIAASESAATVTVPQAGGHLHPLCAIYRKQFLAPAARALAENRNKLDALFSEVEVQIIREEELKAASFTPSIFRNLNTPEDLAENRRRQAR
jgi:molybdopterin-guanine dinucleotide biosynthesis protein A